MKFRLIWMGSEAGPEQHQGIQTNSQPLPPKYAVAHYDLVGGQMVRWEPLEHGKVKVTPLTNFSARIVRDIVWDDDAVQRREFAIEAEVAGEKLVLVLPADEFARMGWVLRKLGPLAILYPGQQQHARAAIQSLSGAVRQEHLFTHLGWSKQGDKWAYLLPRGALGAEGTLTNLQVRLPPSLEHYQVQSPADSDERIKSVRSSLNCLSVAPDRIIVPLMAAVYRAPLGAVDFSLFLTGRTGVFKTALASVCQQHFGAAMDARRLPGHFASTANALEELAYQAKDALLVVDDFAPTGGTGDDALEGVAERLFRAAGNGQGRSRMRGSQLKAARPPRALLLATGEEVPRGHSLRARLLIMELRPGEVDRTALGRCQMAGQEGRLMTAMGAYLTWVARDHEKLQDLVRSRSLELRADAHEDAAAVHARLPGIVAELRSAWEIWLRFAWEVKAISNREHAELEQRGQRALEEVAALQMSYHQGSDPALRFLYLLREALAGGHAHVTNRRGDVPEFPERWGWLQKPRRRAWLPQGTRIGWLSGNDVFLEPSASYQVAQQLAGRERLPVSALTLRQRLREHGLLVSVDVGRKMLLVRRTLEGESRKVLHLRASDLMGLVPKPA